MPEYFAGLDLGQANDPSALAIAERLPGAEPSYRLRHLQRYPLGTSYVRIVELVAELFGREPLRTHRPVLVLDKTGVGAVVYDVFVRARLSCRLVPVTIHGGDAVTPDGDGFRCPKRELIGACQVLLQAARLKIAPELPEAATLRDELQNYRVKLSDAGHDSYSAREGAHDDVLLATALAVWFAERAPWQMPFVLSHGAAKVRLAR